MNRKVVYSISLCLLILSCSEKRYLTTFSDIKFSSTYKPVVPFRIDGFYMCEEELNDSTLPQTQKLLFYEDGSYGESLWNHKVGNTPDMSQEADVNKAFVDIGGIYKVSHDTLFVTTYSRYFWQYIIVKHKFVINDDETLTKFEVEAPELNPRNHFIKRMSSKYVFIPLDSKSKPPKNIHYLKKHKWIWSNEFDWQKYIEEYTVRVRQGIK